MIKLIDISDILHAIRQTPPTDPPRKDATSDGDTRTGPTNWNMQTVPTRHGVQDSLRRIRMLVERRAGGNACLLYDCMGRGGRKRCISEYGCCKRKHRGRGHPRPGWETGRSMCPGQHAITHTHLPSLLSSEPMSASLAILSIWKQARPPRHHACARATRRMWAARSGMRADIPHTHAAGTSAAACNIDAP